jgi:hypothetical protein
MFLFWLGLFLALLNNSAMFGQISSLDSEGNTSFATIIEWPCLPDYDETCYLIISDQGIETGP